MFSLTSRNNPRIKQIRLLRQRKKRGTTDFFLVEGIRHIGEAVDAGAAIETICFSPQVLSSEYALTLIQRLQTLGVTCLAVDAETFQGLADKDHPQGILAVVHKPQHQLIDLTPENFSWGVALVSPQDPGNIGAILRTIDAVGAQGLLLLDNSADPYHPNAVRASMGTLFSLPVVRTSFARFQNWALQFGYHIYGTSAHANYDYRSVQSYQRPLVLLMGSEREGLNPEQMGICELLVRLPMHGQATSINLAVAAGVFLYSMLEKLSPIPPIS